MTTNPLVNCDHCNKLIRYNQTILFEGRLTCQACNNFEKLFTPDKYIEFYSMGDLVKAIARTLKVMSWGAHAWTKFNDHVLRFKVNAHRHKGHIYIAVNGKDLFDVWLTTTRGRILKAFNDIFIEDLINIIDKEIEYIEGYNH